MKDDRKKGQRFTLMGYPVTQSDMDHGVELLRALERDFFRMKAKVLDEEMAGGESVPCETVLGERWNYVIPNDAYFGTRVKQDNTHAMRLFALMLNDWMGFGLAVNGRPYALKIVTATLQLEREPFGVSDSFPGKNFALAKPQPVLRVVSEAAIELADGRQLGFRPRLEWAVFDPGLKFAKALMLAGIAINE